MFCSNCGMALPEDANFCLKCGKPQRTGAQFSEDRFETCEIVWFTVHPASPTRSEEWFKFVAEAIAPTGKYTAFESILLGRTGDTGHQMNEHKLSHYADELVELLIQDGWGATETRGAGWYSYRFRRVWNPNRTRRESCEIGVVDAGKGLFDFRMKFAARSCLSGKLDNNNLFAIVAESSPFRKGLDKVESKSLPDVVATHRSLIAQLLGDGWNLEEHEGERWWQKRLHRNAR